MNKTEIDKAILHFECQATNAAGLNNERGIEIMKYCDMAIEALKEKREAQGISADRLREIIEAEKEGRCVVLPCKVGDTVYTVELDCKDNPDHTRMCFCWNKSCKKCEKAYLRVWENRTKTADIRGIVSEMGLCGEKGGFGKTVFLTHEAAEEALKVKEKER